VIYLKKVPIEALFSSRGRVKIIKILAKEGELNISEIVRRTKLNHSTVYQHLMFLESIGIVQEKTFGRIKIYRFKDENIKARALKKFIEVWEEWDKNEY